MHETRRQRPRTSHVRDLKKEEISLFYLSPHLGTSSCLVHTGLYVVLAVFPGRWMTGITNHTAPDPSGELRVSRRQPCRFTCMYTAVTLLRGWRMTICSALKVYPGR